MSLIVSPGTRMDAPLHQNFFRDIKLSGWIVGTIKFSFREIEFDSLRDDRRVPRMERAPSLVPGRTMASGKSGQEKVRRGKLGQAQDVRSIQICGCIRCEMRIRRCGCARSGVPMSKHEPSFAGGASETASRARPGGSRLAAARPSASAEIGFVGLGHMGTAMAANLAAAGRRVIAYVRRPDQMGKLAALGLRPTTDIVDLFDCEVVISMLPDDDAVHDVVFGRSGPDLDGLAAGLNARRDPSFDEHDQHGGRVAAGERACAARARLRRSAGVRKSGCRQGAPAVHRCRRRCGRHRALPADPRQPRAKDVCDRCRSGRRKPRQAAWQHDERDRAGDARRSRCRDPQARAGSRSHSSTS